PFYAVALYNYYHGIIDHSGINFKGQWWQPWQPDAQFHDEHHQFFHCNYGFNMSLWDKFHGTMRKINRVYTEETFHGEAPLIDSVEAKKIIETDSDAKEFVEKTKGIEAVNTSKDILNSKQ
ncbi:jg6592, partial [Pararge aegeria aegeria]